MLQFGIKIKSTKEVVGQIPRLLVGGVKSFVGYIPVGNTGGANVPPLKTMEMPKDIQEIINKNLEQIKIENHTLKEALKAKESNAVIVNQEERAALKNKKIKKNVIMICFIVNKFY